LPISVDTTNAPSPRAPTNPAILGRRDIVPRLSPRPPAIRARPTKRAASVTAGISQSQSAAAECEECLMDLSATVVADEQPLEVV
jgi:hypothetical protein